MTPLDTSTTPIAAPLRLDNPDAFSWQARCDAIVVGFGAAGACAALEAAAGGREVIVAERFEGGGASIKSGGVVYAGGGTPYQAEAGYHDTPRAMADYLRQEVGDVVSETTLQSFCARSRDML